MMKVGWSSAAAETVLACSYADQRHIVDAVGELCCRLEKEVSAVTAESQQCISASGYDILIRVSVEGVEVQNIQPSGHRAWKK